MHSKYLFHEKLNINTYCSRFIRLFTGTGAEQLLKGTKTERSGNMIIYKTIFYHNNLFVTKIARDNKIARIDKISKTQYTITTDQFSSYSLLENGSKLYFIFKEFLRQDNMLKNVELGNGYIVELDGAGNQKKSITQPVEGDNNLMLWPVTSIPVSGNELIYSTVSLDYKDYVINKLTVK